ncbi:MAG: response regulator transcription factor [Saprospiraceae bacterium]|nr:response regulator transcription factor [Saprospiraceae bacterium]
MTKIVLIAKDPNFRKELRSLIGKCDPECQVMEEVGSIADARPLLAALSPDALLLDAVLPDGSGFELLDGFPKDTFQVVIMADNAEAAIQAFEYNAVGFLKRPLNESELTRALEKLHRNEPSDNIARQLQLLLRGAQPKHQDRLILHLSEGIHILPLNETIRLESDGCYTSFFTSNGERIVVTRAIGEFEHLTENGPFFRVHQSHIVNLNYVRKVLKEDGGFVVLDSGVKVPIARRRKDDFFQSVIRYSTT